MTKAEKKNILFQMHRVIMKHVDHKTDEANLTTLAEEVAHFFEHDEWLDDPDHEVWELAILAEEIRKRN